MSLDIDDLAVVEFRRRTGFSPGLRREARGDDLDFSFKAFGEGISDDGPDRWDEEEKADGVGEKAGGQKDRSGEENHETVERFSVGHASFAGGLLEFRHGEAALGFGQGSADDRSDNDDRDGVGKPKPGAQGHEEVELGQGDEDEEKEEFSKHDSGERIMRVAGISTTISVQKKVRPISPPKDWPPLGPLFAKGFQLGCKLPPEIRFAEVFSKKMSYFQATIKRPSPVRNLTVCFNLPEKRTRMGI